MALSTDEQLHEQVTGMTVVTAFLDTVRDHGDRRALRWMDGDDWHEMTFAEMADQAARVATGLAAAGIGHGDRVVLMMRNIAEFHVADMAVLLCGATPVSIYNSSSPEQVAYLAGHCEAKLGIVEDSGFLSRFTEVADQLPDLHTLVIIKPDADAEGDLTTWADLLANDPVDLATAAQLAQPDDLATIIYTSGTTGNPKGVMLDHTNICWTLACLREAFETDNFVGQRVVSYLPMAHIAERATSYYGGAMNGYEVTCCPDPSLIANYAREVKPNIMFGVPRVWEKIHAGVTSALAADPEKAKQVAEAVEVATPIVDKMTWGTASPEEVETYQFLDAVAFSTIRELIGLDQLDLAVTGAAPITPELLQWFRAIGVPLSEIYGMSESSGPMTFAARRPRPGTVGPAIPGLTLRIADDGEVVCKGGNVFKGYLNDPDKTAEALDEDGWLHSGDIGELDEDGYLRIVDRKKELIITAGGKNISPANLEAALKTIPLVGQACAVGDNRPFVAALVVLDPEVAPVWAAQHGLEGRTLEELAQTPAVINEVNAGLADAMSRFNNAERVKRVTVLGEEWLPDSDLMTPTSKLKRRGILSKFAEEIEAFYE
ncbi:MAG: AMP-dependent synthetase/ligase [Acidimicrobiales bacterium]